MRQFNMPNLLNAVMAGALWFVGLGVVGAVTAATGDPANLGASLGVMVFGILGAGVLLSTLRALRQVGDIPLPNEKSHTSSIKIQRRGASRAA